MVTFSLGSEALIILFIAPNFLDRLSLPIFSVTREQVIFTFRNLDISICVGKLNIIKVFEHHM
jgi:hypothetical protein